MGSEPGRSGQARGVPHLRGIPDGKGACASAGPLQQWVYPSSEAVLEDDIGPLINLGTQHNGRSARTWMKRVLTTFVSLWEGEKDLLESTKMDFYET